MRKYIFVFMSIFWLICSAYAKVTPKINDLKIGAEAPNFSLKGIDNQMHSLDDYCNSKILMIAFISNHCPSSQSLEKRLIAYVNQFKDQSVQVVAINPNHPDALGEGELGFSKYGDSFEEMKLHAKEKGFNFPYLYDGDTQKTVKAYGGLATPHVFIFDHERKLRYKGRFDDSRFPQEETVERRDAQNATEAILANKEVKVKVTKPHGCSTKWIEKGLQKREEIVIKPNPNVKVELLNNQMAEKLLKNDLGNHRLVNFWATYCGPCKAEFPDLVNLSRRYRARNLDVITISLDSPNQIDQVKTYISKQGLALSPRNKVTLEKEGRTTNNFIYSGSNQDELANIFDSNWPGPIPHTVLLNPEGEIVWSHNGIFDKEELRLAILENLGTYNPPKK